MGVDEGNLQSIDVDRRDTGRLSNNLLFVVVVFTLKTVAISAQYLLTSVLLQLT